MQSLKAPTIIGGYDLDVDEEIRTPIKLDADDVGGRIRILHGFKFIDTAYGLACPTCGRMSGVSLRLDVDKKIDWFLKFGCKCYNETKKVKK